MIVTWIVVLDDGTRPYGADVTVDQRRPLRLYVGEDTTIEISLINPVGGVVLLGSGDFLVLNARTLCVPTRQLFAARSVPISGQRYQISVDADDTKGLIPQRGVFDLWAVRGAGADRTDLIPLSELLLAPSALVNNYV